MTCFRIDISRRLAAYLDGELGDTGVRRIERHLLDCFDCRARLVQLRQGRQFAERLQTLAPRHDAWARIEAALDAPPAREPARPWRERLTAWAPRTALGRAGWAVALVLVLLNMSMFVRRPSLGDVEIDAKQAAELDREDFHVVQISNIGDNTMPHIVAEGRVAEINVDDEDGDVKFKLVDDQRPSDSFVVCEVIRPLGVSPPPVGSRVRVYGVSRFDNQANHEWYEIHPVLGIEMLQAK